MNTRRACALVTLLAITASGCSAAVESQGLVVPDNPVSVIGAETLAPGSAAAPTSTESPPATEPPDEPRAESPSTTAPPTEPTAPPDEAPPPSGPTTTTTTTTTVPLDVYDPACVVQAQPNQGILEIADRFDDDTVDAQTIMAENGMTSAVLEVGQLLDVCVDNGLNDIDGTSRGGRNDVLVAREVEAQQRKLNELFAGYGIRELLVDGVSGPVTRQRLCAFRLAAGLPVTLTDMEAGSEEEQELMAAETLPIPFTSALLSERWALIDRTCQIMFVGTGTTQLHFVFPTSTGDAQHRTRDQNRSEVFKYNPASANGGWHNSLTYPAAEDNPLNGNMYKPLYFDNGLAIHGANNVPRSPASKGCARLRVSDMDTLVNWLGLGGQGGVTYRESQINLTVNVQGRYPW